MRIKSYFAPTVEDAMAAARKELGPEAMLIDSRKTPLDAAGMGEYEVVFAEAAADPASIAPQTSAPLGDRLSVEVAELKRELEGMRRTLTRSALTPSPWLAAAPEMSEAYAALTASEVAPELAREIVQSAAARVASFQGPAARGTPPRIDPEALGRALAEEVESRVAVEPQLGRGDNRPRIAALVGPPGCGKTTTLVKLAVTHGLAARKPTLILSMDTYRVAAAEQLRAYAAILGVHFHVLETVNSLSQVIEENRGKEYILIDTPGYGAADMDHAPPLARFLAGRSEIDRHLVLPASMKPSDLTRVVDAFECFRPQRLLFTKLDETASFGPLLNEAARTGKPLSFFGTGQRIPEDLEHATRARMAELTLTGRAAQTASAA